MKFLKTVLVAATLVLFSPFALEAQCPKADEYMAKLSAGEGHHYSYAAYFEKLKCRCQAGVPNAAAGAEIESLMQINLDNYRRMAPSGSPTLSAGGACQVAGSSASAGAAGTISEGEAVGLEQTSLLNDDAVDLLNQLAASSDSKAFREFVGEINENHGKMDQARRWNSMLGGDAESLEALNVYESIADLLTIGEALFGGNNTERTRQLKDITENHQLPVDQRRAAHMQLAHMYRNGIEVERDYFEVFRHYYHAGGSEGLFGLADVYMKGLHVSPDTVLARTYYREAALRGHVPSQLAMAIFYSNGWVESRDLEKAAVWYTRAARQGSEAARRNLARVYEELGRSDDAVRVRSDGLFPPVGSAGLEVEALYGPLIDHYVGWVIDWPHDRLEKTYRGHRGCYVCNEVRSGSGRLEDPSRPELSLAQLTQLYIESGADIDSKNASGENTLHYLVYRTDTAAFALIEGGADVNARTASRATPLHLVVASLATADEDVPSGEHLRFVRALIDAGADLTTKNADGETPLALAQDQLNSSEMLSDYDQLSPQQRDSHRRHADEYREIMDVLRAAGGSLGDLDIYVLMQLQRSDREAFLQAVRGGAADAALQTDQAVTLLGMAQDATELRLLLEHGANINGKNEASIGETPLHTALSLLVSPHFERTPEVVLALIEAGADVNAQNVLGGSPLMAAAAACRVRLVERLLAAGADATLSNSTGAYLRKHEAVLSGASKREIRRSEGLTALHKVIGSSERGTCSQADEITIIEALLAAGADVNAESEQGRPYGLARENSTRAVADLLKRHGAR